MIRIIKKVLIRMMSLFLPALVIWIAAYRRNLHMMKWNSQYLYLYIGLVSAALIISITVYLLTRFEKAKLLSLILSLVSVFITAGFFLYLSPYVKADDKAPILLQVENGRLEYPGIAISWNTKDPEIGKISFGDDQRRLNKRLEEDEATKEHVFTFEGLVPGTTYYYSCSFDDEQRSFTYLPEYEGGLRLGIASDAHVSASDSDNASTAAVLEDILAEENRYAAFFNLGDVVEMGSRDKEYVKQAEFLSPYVSRIPTSQLPGNHDLWFAGNHHWESYFYPKAMPDESGSPFYHHYRYGEDIHVFTLDLEWGTETYTKRQKRWFEKELANTEIEDTVIVMSHAFFFASGSDYEGIAWYDNQEMIGEFHNMFVEHGIDWVFSGHNHQMEVIDQDGTCYVIIGTLGGHFEPEPEYISEGSVFRDFSTFGYADLLLKEGESVLNLRDQEGNILFSLEK